MMRGYDYTPERHVKLMFKRQDGKCSVAKCRKPIHMKKPRDFIIEHENQISISKDNRLKNKSLRCKECAHRKTHGTKATTYGSDDHARAKIRHLRGENKPRPKREIPPRPFPKSQRKLSSAPFSKTSRPFQKRKKT